MTTKVVEQGGKNYEDQWALPGTRLWRLDWIKLSNCSTPKLCLLNEDQLFLIAKLQGFIIPMHKLTENYIKGSAIQ